MIYDGEYKVDIGEFVKKGDVKGKEFIVILF